MRVRIKAYKGVIPRKDPSKTQLTPSQTRLFLRVYLSMGKGISDENSSYRKTRTDRSANVAALPENGHIGVSVAV